MHTHRGAVNPYGQPDPKIYDGHNFDEDDVDVLKIERCVLTNLTLQMPPLDGVRSPDGWITFTRTQARSSWEAPKNHDHDDHGHNDDDEESG